MSILSKKIGIDLGTSTVQIYVKGEGIVVNEPAVAARDRQHALQKLIAKAQGRARLFRPDVALSVPSTVTSDERRAVTAAAIAAGARQAWLIDDPLAAAIGAGLPIAERRASAICDIGGSTTEIAVISLSGMVVARSIPVGGSRMDEAIVEYVKRKHNLCIDRRTAERVKIAAGSAVPMQEPLMAEVGDVKLSSNDVVEAIQGPLRLIAGAIRDVLQETPPELAADVSERGIVLSGGGAQLRGLDRYISMHAGIPVVVAEEPQTLVARGTGLALENFEVLKRNQSNLH